MQWWKTSSKSLRLRQGRQGRHGKHGTQGHFGMANWAPLKQTQESKWLMDEQWGLKEFLMQQQLNRNIWRRGTFPSAHIPPCTQGQSGGQIQMGLHLHLVTSISHRLPLHICCQGWLSDYNLAAVSRWSKRVYAEICCSVLFKCSLPETESKSFQVLCFNLQGKYEIWEVMYFMRHTADDKKQVRNWN